MSIDTQTKINPSGDGSQGQTPAVPMNEQPSYVKLNNMEQARFISQVGPFTSKEKNVFNFLCQRWEPMMEYDMLFYELGQDDLMASFGSLMAKLRRYAMGSIIYQTIDNRLEPGSILLCERFAAIFYTKLIDQSYQRIQMDFDIPFPVTSDDDFSAAIEQKRVHKVEYEQLCSLLKREAPLPQEPLIGVATYFGRLMLLPTLNINLAVEMARAKLQSYFSDKRIIALFKRLNHGFREQVLRTRPFELDPEFWLDACSRFLDRRSDFENVLPPPNESYYQAGLLIRRMARVLVDAKTESKVALLRRENDMSAILQNIREHGSPLLTAQQYRALFEKYRLEWGNDFEKTIKDFETKYYSPSPRRKLALLYRWGNGIIHSERVYDFCTSCIRDMSHQLDDEYIADLRRWLRSHTQSWHSAFDSLDGFEHSLRTSVQKRDRFLFMTLTNTELWSEIVVAGVRNIAKSHQKSEFNRRMRCYFEADLKTIKPFKHIFDLSLEDIFDRGFNGMNAWRRFILHIFGIHRNLKQRFHAFSMGKEVADSNTRRSQKLIKASRRQIRQERKRRQYAANKNSVITGKPSHYSKTERDTAWEEFQHRLQKK